MDKIIISDLEIFAYHGVLPEEKILGQKFIVSLELFLDLLEAAKSDRLELTVNYAKICEEVEEYTQKNVYDLIEALANNLAIFLLEKYPIIRKIKVQVKKPWAPVKKPLKFVAVELERGWIKAYIGLGSNMGDKDKNIGDAISLINGTERIKVTAISKSYLTKPVGYTEQEEFVNAVIEVDTLLGPHQLLDVLLAIEKQLKRERVIKWGPRTIDLDILFFDDLIIMDDKLQTPHPRMHERLFAITPLCDIAPFLRHPVLGKSMLELKEKLEKTQSL